MTTPSPPAPWPTRTLLALTTLLYLGVAVAEWRLGSAYHLLLALGIAALAGVLARGPRFGLGLGALALLLTLYGVYRLFSDLRLL